jgi:hypothetical protein
VLRDPGVPARQPPAPLLPPELARLVATVLYPAHRPLLRELLLDLLAEDIGAMAAAAAQEVSR